MKILILDDDKNRHIAFKKLFVSHEIYHAYTVSEAKSFIKDTKFDAIFLDHDLGGQIHVNSFGDEETGYTFALFLSQNPGLISNTDIFIHSFNPIGAQNMKNVLPKSIIVPGAWNN